VEGEVVKGSREAAQGDAKLRRKKKRAERSSSRERESESGGATFSSS
jgi:hypothetical protein